MTLTLEIFSRGLRHARFLYEFDEAHGCMVRGFSVRAGGIWVRLAWRST